MNCCFVNFVVVFLFFFFCLFETPLLLSKWPSGLSLLSKILGRLLVFLKEERRPTLPTEL